MRTLCAVGVTACVYLHSYRWVSRFIVICFGRVPARIHQKTAHSADFLCAATPPHQHYCVLLALLTPPCLKTVIGLVARALTTHNKPMKVQNMPWSPESRNLLDRTTAQLDEAQRLILAIQWWL